MNGAHETTGVVEGGSIRLPPDIQLPEGTTVRVSWNDAGPYDRQPLTEGEVRADLAWATREPPTK